jgi:hypothetical protein
MASAEAESPVTFDGSNWQDLTRLVTATRMKFLQTVNMEDGHDPYTTDSAKCAKLVSYFRGPALDWAGAEYDNDPTIFANYSTFVVLVRQAFGISDEGLSAQRRGQLEGLKWGPDLPVFFAEFDRLTQLLGLTGDAVRIALVRSKLPVHVQTLLAQQALNFASYDTMRERLQVMWALDPGRTISKPSGTQTASRRPRCGKCGKRGHAAPDCRSKN